MAAAIGAVTMLQVSTVSAEGAAAIDPGLKDYQKARLMVFVNPSADPLGAGHQAYVLCELATPRDDPALRGLLDFHKVAPDTLIVAYDDLNIDLGLVKVSVSGSAGGHNGVASLLEHLGGAHVLGHSYGGVVALIAAVMAVRTVRPARQAATPWPSRPMPTRWPMPSPAPSTSAPCAVSTTPA